MTDSKQIKDFIKPNLLPVIILFFLPPLTIISLVILLFVTIPAYVRAKKSLAKLEGRGELDKAASEICSPAAKRYVRSKLILTENYVFCKGNGHVFTYDEIAWVYKYTYVKRALFIPIKTTESLYLGTGSMKPNAVATMGKDKMEEIKNAMLEIRKHNDQCLLGYNDANIASYKNITAK